MMDAAYFQRWKNSNELERLHREFHAKTLLSGQLDAAYRRIGYERPQNPHNRHNRKTLGSIIDR